MEELEMKDGTEKTLFDYSPQNQNYIILNDLLRWERENNDVPLLDKKQAEKVFKIVGRKFGAWKHCVPTTFNYKVKRKFLDVYLIGCVRQCWYGSHYRNNYKRLLHDISHYIQDYRTGSSNHCTSQSKLEKEIVEWVIENDWLRDKIKHPEPKAKPVKTKPTKIEINETKISRLDKAIENQEKKIKSIMESMWKNKTTRNRLKNLVEKQKQEQ